MTEEQIRQAIKDALRAAVERTEDSEDVDVFIRQRTDEIMDMVSDYGQQESQKGHDEGRLGEDL